MRANNLFFLLISLCLRSGSKAFSGKISKHYKRDKTENEADVESQ